jgi:capsular polysaccharide biosynthesis protein
LTLKAFLTTVRRFRGTFLLVAGAVFILGATSIVLSPGKFVSSTRLMVSVEGSTTASAYQNDAVAARRVSSYIPLLTSGVVLQRVIDKLGLPLSPAGLADEIGVANVPPKTSLIDVEVTDGSPGRAKRIADTLASEFIAYAASIETPTGEDSHKIDTAVVTPAAEGRENHWESVLLGVLAGVTALLLGAVAVWIRAARRPALPLTESEGSAGDGDGASPIESAVVESEDGEEAAPYSPKHAVAASPENVEAGDPVIAD